MIRKSIRKLGIDLVRYPVHSTLEGHLRSIFSACGITVLLDAGANVGQFALRARREARFRGRIESFEPTPGTFDVVTARASNDDLWRTHRCALGAENEELVLHMFDSSEWNSLHPPDESQLRAAGRSLTSVGRAPVPVRRLDGMWDELVQPDDVVMVKSDTQGHELEVLTGAGTRLASVEAVLLEGSLTTFYEGEPALTVMLEQLRLLGFMPSGFFPVTRQQGTLALDTVDVSFVRRDG